MDVSPHLIKLLLEGGSVGPASFGEKGYCCSEITTADGRKDCIFWGDRKMVDLWLSEPIILKSNKE